MTPGHRAGPTPYEPDRWDTLDILINHAGVQVLGDSHEIRPQAFERVIATNGTDAYVCSRVGDDR